MTEEANGMASSADERVEAAEREGGDEAEPRRAECLRDEEGATMLEYVLLLAAIALPGYVLIRLALDTLIGHYQMMSTLNSLPTP